ncbi:atp-dependent clp protease proteolytic subunit [Holotrichia oblita]|nr:atp-dependent clp protease proteolytic subunit [Holotrichia oblita]
MGAVILSAGTPGKRCALPHAEIMIHQPLASLAKKQVTDIEIHTERIKEMKRELLAMLAYNCGKTYEEIERDTNRDNFMTAKKALEYGIIDQAGAICSILSYYEPNLKDVAVTDYVQGSRIDDELQLALNEFINYSKEKALELSNGVELHGKYAEKALERMLAHLSELGYMLYRSANNKEKQAIKSAYSNMLQKMI